MSGGSVPVHIPPQTTPIARNEVDIPWETAEFLNLKLLHTRNRVVLSQSFELRDVPGRLNYFAVANSKGWFSCVGKRDNGTYQLQFSPLLDLRLAFASEEQPRVDRIDLLCKRIVPVAHHTPISLKLTCNDERLVVTFVEGIVAVYDTAQLFVEAGDAPVEPLFIFQGGRPRDIISNPGDNFELVAVLRGDYPATTVEIIDTRRLAIVNSWCSDPSTGIYPTSISWSAKGKQLAIGLSTCDIITYSPEDAAKVKTLFSRPDLSNNYAATALSWLTNSLFFSIHSGHTELDLLNVYYVSSYDAKSASALDMKFEDPCPAFGLSFRPSSPQTLVLRNWSPFQYLLFVSDGPATEIGVVGNLHEPSGDRWVNVSLDESSSGLPLDEYLSETSIIGFDFDFTATAPTKGENKTGEEAELPPGPILYAYINDGTILGRNVYNDRGGAYPGMIASSLPNVPQSSFSTPKQSAFTPQSVQTSSFSSPQFQPSQRPVFEEVPSRSPSPTGSADKDMEDTTFGGLSLGETSTVNTQSAHSMFGPSIAASSSSTSGALGSDSVSSGFGSFSSSSIRPASGFGAFSGAVASTTTGPFTASKNTPATSLTFGASGFGSPAPSQTQQSPNPSKVAPAFGSSGFSANKSFTGFGSSSFSSTGFGAVKSASAFGTSGFGSSVGQPSSSFSGGFGGFASAPSAFGAPPSTSSQPSPFSVPLSGQGTPSKPTSAFGAGGFGAAQTLPTNLIPSETDTESKQSPSVEEKVSETSSTANASSSTPPEASLPVPHTSPSRTTAGTSTASPLQPSIGFGSFGNKDASTSLSPSKPTPQSPGFAAAFGKGPVGSSSPSTPASNSKQPAFGQSSFGSPKVAPTFGSASLSFKEFPTTTTESSATPATTASKSSFGGFASFSTGPSTFSSPKPDHPSFLKESTKVHKADQNVVKGPEMTTAPVTPSSDEHSANKQVSDTGVLVAETSEIKSANEAVKGTSMQSLDSSYEKINTNEESLTSLKDVDAQIVDPKEEGEEGEGEGEVEEVEEGEEGEDENQEESVHKRRSDQDDAYLYVPSTASSTEDPDESGEEDSLLEFAEKESTPTAGASRKSARLQNQNLQNAATDSNKDLTPPEPKISPLNPPLSTTPPGSPIQLPNKPAEPQKLPSPKSMPGPSAPPIFPVGAKQQTTDTTPTKPGLGSFSLGLGRPSSRPTRSSPLANASSFSADDADESSLSSATPSRPPTVSTKGVSTSQQIPPESISLIKDNKLAGVPSITHKPGPVTPQPPAPLSSESSSKKPISFQFPQRTFPTTPSKLSTSQPLFATPPNFVNDLSKGAKATPQAPPIPVINEPETAMQRAMANACETINNELVLVSSKILDAASRQASSRHGESLDVKISDTLKGLKGGVQNILRDSQPNHASLSGFQDTLLKQEIQLQYIKRLSAVIKDPNYTKMSESRPLNPEQLEKQDILRRKTKETAETVKHLESLVADLRTKIDEQEHGRINLKTPSLVTIDRTCALLEGSLAAQSKRLDKLVEQTQNLNLSNSRNSSNNNESLPPGRNRVSSAVIAKNVADALNAESAGQYLKIAMLTTMKEPLLTTKVIDAYGQEALNTTLPIFRRPGSAEKPEVKLAAEKVEPPPPLAQTPSPIPWTLPPLATPQDLSGNVSPGSIAHSGRQGSAKKSAHHAKPVSTGSSSDSPRGPAVFAPPSGFSWGALPVTPKATSGVTLPVDLRPPGSK